MTEASTGPAQGTNAAPSTRPRPKPALSPVVRGARRAKGCSRTSMTFGTIIPMPTATSSTMPAQRIAGCGRCSRLSSAEPATVISMNDVTRPATIRRGRRATLGESSTFFAVTAGEEPPLPRLTPGATRNRPGSTALAAFSEDEAVEAFAESLPPAAPRNKTGRTGRMHGEMPVTSPPRRPSKRNIGLPYLVKGGNARDVNAGVVKAKRGARESAVALHHRDSTRSARAFVRSTSAMFAASTVRTQCAASARSRPKLTCRSMRREANSSNGVSM